MIALAERCMADYDEDGWTGDTWLDPTKQRRAACVTRGALGWFPPAESPTFRP